MILHLKISFSFLSLYTAIGTYSGSTMGQSGDVQGQDSAEDIYRFQAPSSGTSGTYIFSSCGSSFDTYMHIYTIASGTATQLLHYVAHADDNLNAECQLHAILTVPLINGQWYVVCRYMWYS